MFHLSFQHLLQLSIRRSHGIVWLTPKSPYEILRWEWIGETSPKSDCILPITATHCSYLNLKVIIDVKRILWIKSSLEFYIERSRTKSKLGFLLNRDPCDWGVNWYDHCGGSIPSIPTKFTDERADWKFLHKNWKWLYNMYSIKFCLCIQDFGRCLKEKLKWVNTTQVMWYRDKHTPSSVDLMGSGVLSLLSESLSSFWRTPSLRRRAGGESCDGLAWTCFCNESLLSVSTRVLFNWD